MINIPVIFLLDSPASRAGLKPGDVLLSLDHTPLSDKTYQSIINLLHQVSMHFLSHSFSLAKGRPKYMCNDSFLIYYIMYMYHQALFLMYLYMYVCMYSLMVIIATPTVLCIISKVKIIL